MAEEIADDGASFFCNENAVPFDVSPPVLPVTVTAVFLSPVFGKADQLPDHILVQLNFSDHHFSETLFSIELSLLRVCVIFFFSF